MNNPIAWPLSQHHSRGGSDEDLGMRGISSSQQHSYAQAALAPSTGTFPGAMAPSSASYYPRPYNGSIHCRPSQQMLSANGGGEAAGDGAGPGGGGVGFAHCVEPNSQRPSPQQQGRTMCQGREGSPERLEGSGSGQALHGSVGGESDRSSCRENGSGGGGGCGFIGDPVLSMMDYSPQQMDAQQQQRMKRELSQQQQQQQHHQRQMQLERRELQQQQLFQHQQQQQQNRGALSGHWPQNQSSPLNEEWGLLMDRSATPTMTGSQQQSQLTPGFSASPWPTIHNIAEKQPWGSQPHYSQHERQQLDQSHGRHEGQEGRHHDHPGLKHDPQGSPTSEDVVSPPYPGYLPQQQQQQNGWSAPRISPSQPLSPQRASAHSTPAAAAAVAAATAAMEGGGGSMARDDPSGRMRVAVRPAPGTPGGGGRASKTARTTGPVEKEEGGGGAKADGRGGGGGENKRRQSEDSLRDLLPEERLKLNRERNRDHSRRSRERKKAYVEGLKKQVSELGAYRMLVEEAHDLISAHSTDVNAFFTFASAGFDRLLGMDPADLLGVSFLALVDPEDNQEVLRSVLSTLRRGGIRQVQYRMRPPAGAHAAEVETSFRLVSTRLVAVTRVRGRSPSPCESPQPQEALPSLTMSTTATSQVPPHSPLLVQPLSSVGGIRAGGGSSSGGLSFSGEW